MRGISPPSWPLLTALAATLRQSSCTEPSYPFNADRACPQIYPRSGSGSVTSVQTLKPARASVLYELAPLATPSAERDVPPLRIQGP